MKKKIGFMICVALMAGCSMRAKQAEGGRQKQVMEIRWQRLVDEKRQTCDRCGTIGTATEDGVKKLRSSLKELDIHVVLKKMAVSSPDFAKDPVESNRIWIADKPIEEWLQATLNKSRCGGACGDTECRTITVGGKTYDTVPSELIVKAGLLASAQLVGSKPRNPWNPLEEWSKESLDCCPSSAGGGRK